MNIAYFPGCTLHASSKLYDVQSKLVLNKLDVQLKELDDWNCCGATSASKTDDFLAMAMPARNLGIADHMGLSHLVIPCSACYSRMRVAKKRLESDEPLKKEINGELKKKVTGKTEIISILELLVSLMGTREWKMNTHKYLRTLRPACYYGCMQTRFPVDLHVPDNVENPQSMEFILRALGARPIDWSYKTDCCGASASVNDPDLAHGLMANIMRDAIAREADCFVTSCPMCQLNLDAYQEQLRKTHNIGKSMPVYLITELVGLAMGMEPEELQIDRHFVDAVGRVKELPLL